MLIDHMSENTLFVVSFSLFWTISHLYRLIPKKMLSLVVVILIVVFLLKE